MRAAQPRRRGLALRRTADVVATQAGQTFTYRLTSNRGSLNWRIGSLPAWLKANVTSGKTAATIVLTVQSVAVGTYTAAIPFIASTNTVTLNARLTVTAPTPVPVPVPVPVPQPTPSGGHCLDNVGGIVTTDSGDSLTCP
jgi:hypothetical protein